MPVIDYIGVVLPFVGSLLLYRHSFDFYLSLKEALTFLSLSNLILQSEPHTVCCQDAMNLLFL